MSPPRPDLQSLSRLGTTLPYPASPAQSFASSIPRPPSHWQSRVLLPLCIVLATAGVLGFAARDWLRPTIGVYVVPVMPRPVSHAPADPSSIPVTAPLQAAHSPAAENLGQLLVQAPGWIEPAPYATTVAALAEGVIREVLVLEGQSVSAGQLVATMIDDDARLVMRAADAVVRQRNIDIDRARAAVATAEAMVAVERAFAAETRDEITRKRELAAAGLVGAGEFARLELRLDGQEAKIVAAKRLVDETRLTTAQAEAAHALAVVVAEEAALRLSRMQIVSPGDGVVLSRLIGPGSRISMGGTASESAGTGTGAGAGMPGAVLRLYSPASLQVRVDVPLADAAKVAVGARAAVTTEALPDQVFSGTVTRIMQEANIQRNTVQLKVSIDKPSPVLKPEMLTRVKLYPAAGSSARQTSHTDQAARTSGSAGAGASAGALDGYLLLAPIAAVFNTAGGKGWVWLVDGSSGQTLARKREVATEQTAEPDFAAITSGLQISDRLIVDAPADLQDGARITVLGERTFTSALPAVPAKPVSR